MFQTSQICTIVIVIVIESYCLHRKIYYESCEILNKFTLKLHIVLNEQDSKFIFQCVLLIGESSFM